MTTYTGKVTSFALQRAPSGTTRRSFALQIGGTLYRTGGRGRVRGNIFTTPANPVARMAYLYAENDRVLLRKQLSDPLTGAFDFQRLPMGLSYMVVAVDRTGQYRAETHDRLTPELMP